MIEKEFVPYEESLKLKELGFDEPCFRTGWDFDINFNNIRMPTFSQAFRWFREKYKLSFECKTPDGQDGLWFPEIHKIKGFGNYYDNEGFNTYEEAELACLKRLIEIVKEHNI